MSVDVIVTGRSIPALISALDLAEVGMQVFLADEPAGVEPPRQPLADPEGVVSAMLQRVAAPIEGSGAPPETSVLPREVPPLPISVRDRSGEWAPLSEPHLLGIPASPLDARIMHLIGTKGSLRAYIDRIRPVLTVGKTQHLGVLVTQRMGQAVLDTLVDPLIHTRFGVPAHHVDVAIAAPGLNEALTRYGALSAAVLAEADVETARETRVQPEGGGSALHAELMRKLALYNVRTTSEPIQSAVWNGDSWAVHFADGHTLQARALVLDTGRSAVPTTLQQQLCPELTVSHTRIHASTQLAGATAQPAGIEYVEQVTGWSVTSFTNDTGLNQITAISDVREGAASEASAADLEGLSQQGERLRGAALTWSLGVAAAPFATIAAREAAEARVDAVIEGQPHLLPVGRSLFGDDLALALERGSAHTTQLRRRLLGLID